MDLFILLIVVQLTSLNEAFNFLCPSQAHWKLRAKAMCISAQYYTCLYDVTEVNAYRDRCSKSRLLPSGYKYVFQPNLNRAACSSTRYQPFLFETIGRSDCTYLKSLCNSEGQITYENGNTTSDRTCLCNTDKRFVFDFVKNSNNQSYCNPSTEDCSCYIGNKQNNQTTGSKDLRWYDDTNVNQSRLREVQLNELETLQNNAFDSFKYNLYYPKCVYRTKAAMYVILLVVSYILIAAGICCLYIIIRDRITPKNFEVIKFTDRTIIVQWEISDDRLKYELHHRLQDSGDWKTSTLFPEMKNRLQTYTLQDLLPGTCYELQMCSVGYYVKSYFTELKTQKTLTDIPGVMEGLSEEDRNIFKNLITSSEMEKRYFLRIMIVGKEAVGKSCLLKRLLRESIDGVLSTDGIEIVVHQCKIDITDGNWIIGKDNCTDKKDWLGRALAKRKRLINVNSSTPEPKLIHQSSLDHDGNKSTEDKSRDDDHVYDKTKYPDVPQKKTDEYNADAKVMTNQQQSEQGIQQFARTNENILKDRRSNDDNQLLGYPNDNQSSAETSDNIGNKNNKSYMDNASNKARTETQIDSLENRDDNKRSSLVMPSDLMSQVLPKTNEGHSSSKCQYASCGLWDFAGQREFYATHQAFLTSCAIYILVASMEDEVHKNNEQQCYADFENIGDYVEFWFDNIHCHQSVNSGPSKSLDPPVILVFTGKDKYEDLGKANLKKRKQELNEQLLKVKKDQDKYCHHRQTFYLSNKDVCDDDFEKLRKTIFQTAIDMQNWGELIPLKWILLEHLIEINRNSGRNFITLKEMLEIAQHPDIAISEFKEVLLFLHFQCKLGNIIFFDEIANFIILNPQWLAKAFRCLVSNRLEIDNADQQVTSDWNDLQDKGIISDLLITALFQSKEETSFLEQREDLLSVMMKFDILVEIKKKHSYIMPSMMPIATFVDVCSNIGMFGENCEKSSWFCLKFDFLPPAFFNHLSVWLIKRYEASKVQDDSEMLALYRGVCVFDIDDSECDKLLITMSKNIIALRVVTFAKKIRDVGEICSSVRKGLVRKIEVLKRRYQLNLPYEEKYKCCGENYFAHLKSYDELSRSTKMYCHYNKKIHSAEIIYSPWRLMLNEPSEEEIYFLRTVALLHVAKKAVRKIFDDEFNPASLNKWICRNEVFLSRKVRRHINYVQWKMLSSVNASSSNFDLHLMICLLKATTETFICYENRPYDIDQCADLTRIWHYKTQIGNNVNGKLTKEDFKRQFSDLSKAIIRLNKQRHSYLTLKCISLESCDLDDDNKISQEETNYLRLLHFILRVASDVFRECFDKEFPPSTLGDTVRLNCIKLHKLQRSEKLITNIQWALLFQEFSGTGFPIPKSEVSSTVLDIKTMAVLMRHLKDIMLNKKLTKGDLDTSYRSDLSRLWWYRTEIMYISALTMGQFEKRWNDISDIIKRLGGSKYTDVCNQLKTAPLYDYET